MNARQSVVIAMLLAAIIYMLAQANPSTVARKIGSIRQVPAEGIPATTPGVATPGFGGGSSGSGGGGAGGGF